jgi:AcrR family transcriptional regulator
MARIQRKQGRPKASEESLTRERILTAALQLANRHGVAHLTMRRLATALGVDPMSIYHYLPGKAAVIAGMVEMVFGQFRVATTEDAPWQEQVRAFVAAYRHLTRAYANLVLHLVTDAEAGAKAALPANEILYRALAKAGLPPRLVLHAADLIVDYLNGYALAESSGPLAQMEERQGLLDALEEEGAEKFPVMAALFNEVAADHTAVGDDPEVDILLAGIEAIAARSSPT